ncbi:DUF2834 domain-containing protein [Marinicaulis aureus]|uniref:DUF2834 domain-containing protein n=1 Tax=Hyphococcus aureus TaxID=2666033 RepID=A0ABW1KR72_9PROT
MRIGGDPKLYLALTLLGVAVPYAAFIPWIADNGLSPALFTQQAFETRIAAFAWLDVIVSALTVLVAATTTMRGARLAWIVAACFLVGVSAALPLFLYFLAKDSAKAAT